MWALSAQGQVSARPAAPALSPTVSLGPRANPALSTFTDTSASHLSLAGALVEQSDLHFNAWEGDFDDLRLEDVDLSFTELGGHMDRATFKQVNLSRDDDFRPTHVDPDEAFADAVPKIEESWAWADMPPAIGFGVFLGTPTTAVKQEAAKLGRVFLKAMTLCDPAMREVHEDGEWNDGELDAIDAQIRTRSEEGPVDLDAAELGRAFAVARIEGSGNSPNFRNWEDTPADDTICQSIGVDEALALLRPKSGWIRILSMNDRFNSLSDFSPAHLRACQQIDHLVCPCSASSLALAHRFTSPPSA